MNKLLSFCLLLVLLMTTACRLAGPAADAAPVLDSWEMVVGGDAVSVTRTVVIQGALTALVRGSAELDAGRLQAQVAATGAEAVACLSDDDVLRITVTCTYRQPVLSTSGDVQHTQLPGDEILHFLTLLPTGHAATFRVETTGRVVVPGVLAAIPPPVDETAADGSRWVRQFALTSPSQLHVNGWWSVPAGTNPVLRDDGPVLLMFMPHYAPRPAAWLAWGSALVLSLLAVAAIYPVRVHRQRAPELWQPDLTGVSRWLRWLVRLLAAVVNWWRRVWPTVLNGGVGASIMLLGLTLVLAGWQTAPVFGAATVWRDLVQEWLNRAGAAGAVLPLHHLLWAGWPFVMVAAAIVLTILGGGMLATRNAARLGVVGLCLAWLAGVVLVWPQALLSPSSVSLQHELVLVGGMLWLVPPAVLVYGLQHPAVRQLYEREQE